MSDLRVQSGAVIALRLFDIAYSIDLKRVEDLWSQGSGRSSIRSRLSSTPPKALTFDVPPVLLTMNPVMLEIAGVNHQASVSARLYDFGVVALSVRVPATDLSWEAYSGLCDAVDRAIGPKAEGKLWKELLGQIKSSLFPAMLRPNESTLEEDHLVAIVQKWDRPVIGADLPEMIDLVPILSGENRPLSEKTRKDLMKQRFSYYEDDLVVVTWDRAFIYEPRSDSDVSDILEVANAQLLEFRYYDELLDDELPRMYELVKQARRATNLLAPRRFADLARKLYTLVAEVTELTEKADNVLQVT